MKHGEIFISVDIESTGPVPGYHSMYQLGAAVVGNIDQNFGADLKLITDNYVPEALRACNVTIQELKQRGQDPIQVMQDFAEWLEEVADGRRPVIVGFGLPYDWKFVDWYFHLADIPNTFGINGIDIKAYYMGMMNVRHWYETSKRHMDQSFLSSRRHTHNAREDAIEQAEIFQKMLNFNAKRR